MTRSSIRDYARAISPRYHRASKRAKGAILDEFCQTTGYHRKAAIRLLGRAPVAPRARAGRPRQYGPAVVAALRVVWAAADRICGKRLAPFVPSLLESLERHGELSVPAAERSLLLRLSAATIDRLLAPARREAGRPPSTHRPAMASLRAQIPVRTFGEWRGVTPGSLQADLVVHCGESATGFYLTTLSTVDVATGWSECQIVWGKGQQRVGTAVHHVRQRLPFALRELHTDNGSEFLNGVLYPWCQREKIAFTRGRPYKKNDQAYVEQRNWTVVRRLVGYDRYSTKAAYAHFQQLYQLLRLYVNFFQPVRKLVGKERHGAKVVKHFDRAKTPYQRLLDADVLAPAERTRLAALYQELNPAALRRHIDAALADLGKLAERVPRAANPPLAPSDDRLGIRGQLCGPAHVSPAPTATTAPLVQ